MSKIYYTEHIKFEPARAWVVLGTGNKIIGFHAGKADAEKQCITARVKDPDADVTFTKCVVLPNFSLK